MMMMMMMMMQIIFLGNFVEFDPNESMKSRMAKKAVELTVHEAVVVAGDAIGDAVGEGEDLTNMLVCPVKR